VLVYLVFDVWHTFVGDFDSVSVHYFSQNVVFGETFVYSFQKLFTNIGLDVQGRQGVKICDFSFSVFFYFFWLQA
jgi:hypothetical protein